MPHGNDVPPARCTDPADARCVPRPLDPGDPLGALLLSLDPVEGCRCPPLRRHTCAGECDPDAWCACCLGECGCPVLPPEDQPPCRHTRDAAARYAAERSRWTAQGETLSEETFHDWWARKLRLYDPAGYDGPGEEPDAPRAPVLSRAARAARYAGRCAAGLRLWHPGDLTDGEAEKLSVLARLHAQPGTQSRYSETGLVSQDKLRGVPDAQQRREAGRRERDLTEADRRAWARGLTCSLDRLAACAAARVPLPEHARNPAGRGRTG